MNIVSKLFLRTRKSRKNLIKEVVMRTILIVVLFLFVNIGDVFGGEPNTLACRDKEQLGKYLMAWAANDTKTKRQFEDDEKCAWVPANAYENWSITDIGQLKSSGYHILLMKAESKKSNLVQYIAYFSR